MRKGFRTYDFEPEVLCVNPGLLQAIYQVYRPAKQLAYRYTGKPVMKLLNRRK